MADQGMLPEEIIEWWDDYAQHCKGDVAVLHLRDFFEIERDVYANMSQEHTHKEEFLSSDADMAILNHKSAKLCEAAAQKMKTVRQKGGGRPFTYNSPAVMRDYEEVYEEIRDIGFMRLLHYGAYLYQLIRNESDGNHPDWPRGSSKKAEHNMAVLKKLRNDLKEVWSR